MPRTQSGFTLVELLVALAIMFVLGALVVPSIIATVDRSRVEGAADSLAAIREAIILFSDQVREHPASLTQLVVPITGADVDICGQGYSVGEQNQWAGPYLDRALAASGIPVGVGTAANAFTVLAEPGGVDYLQVAVQDVLVEDAQALDLRIDDADGPDSGALRWTAVGPDFVTAHYLIPFLDC